MTCLYHRKRERRLRIITKKLEDLQTQSKNDPFGAISTYITVEDYKGQDFFTVLQGLETSRAGMITRNTLVSDSLKQTFKTLSGDAADGAAMEQEQTGVTTSAPTAAGEPGSKGNPITITAQDFDAEVEAGTLQDGATYSVDGKVVTYKAEKNKVAKPVDMSGAPGFRDRDTIQPVIKEVIKTPEVQEAIDTFKSGLPADLQAEYDAFIKGDKGDIAFESILSDKPLPTDIQEELNKFETEEVPSLTDYFKGVISNLFGSADKEELTEAAKRAPENFEKLAGQLSSALDKASELGYTEENFNPRAIGSVGFQDLGLREDVRDVPEVVEELRKVGLVMPVPDDSMDAKARRGTGRTAMIEPVRPESTPDPLKSAQTLARLRRTNPEYFIDTPPAVTDGDTASQVAAQARTGGDRAPGLMSRMTPTRPSSSDLEGAPRLGDPDFEDLIKRVHGTEKGEAFQEKWSLQVRSKL
jgi:hypothetical protein